MTHRRRIGTALAVGVVTALIVSLGIRQADAGSSGPPPQYYPHCAVGEFNSVEVVTNGYGLPMLNVAGWVAPCERFPADPRIFAWEIRRYYPTVSKVARRMPFQAWFDATYFTEQFHVGGAQAICLVHGGGVGRRIGCVSLTPPEADGPWLVSPLPVDDPLIDVPDHDVMIEPTQNPNPICANCP